MTIGFYDNMMSIGYTKQENYSHNAKRKTLRIKNHTFIQ